MFSLSGLMAKLTKQKNVSPHIGALTTAYASTGILYAPLTLIGVATNIYVMWGGEIIQRWIPWFTFPMMVATVVFLILLAMVLFHKIVIPSQVAFSMQQQYKHRNPLVSDMKTVLSELKDVKNELKGISERLEQLENNKK